MKRKIIIRGFLQSSQLSDELNHAGNAVDFIDMQLNITKDPHAEISKLQARPDVLIIELDGNDPEAINAVSETLKNEGQITTLILLNNSETDIVRSLMRLHVYDVIPLPCDQNELIKDLTDIISEKQHHLESIKSQVISFMNAKGGCGSTTIIVNTAYLLASKYDAKVCIIDLDIQFGKVALFFDAHPTENIMNALNQPERIDPVFTKALITHHDSGVDILASPGTLNDIGGITPEAVAQLIDAISENYEYVFIDMPHVIMPWSMEALSKSDRNFLVVQNCLSIMKDAKLILDKLSSYGLNRQHFEIINNRESKKTGMITKGQMLETLEKEACFSIRNDYSVAIEAQETGKPIAKIALGSGVNKDMETLAKAISSGHTADEKPASLFSRIFHDRG